MCLYNYVNTVLWQKCEKEVPWPTTVNPLICMYICIHMQEVSTNERVVYVIGGKESVTYIRM